MPAVLFRLGALWGGGRKEVRCSSKENISLSAALVPSEPVKPDFQPANEPQGLRSGPPYRPKPELEFLFSRS